jgi:hypothetical protein
LYFSQIRLNLTIMKIRIKGNSIRYRLTKFDLANLLQYGLLSEETEFLGTKLIYSIQLTNDDRITTEFREHVITLQLPTSKAVRLSTCDETGFSDQSGPVHIMVINDFCEEDTVEEIADTV